MRDSSMTGGATLVVAIVDGDAGSVVEAGTVVTAIVEAGDVVDDGTDDVAEDVADADAVPLFDCFVVLPHDASTRVANTAIDVTAMGRPMPSVNP